ncbi:MAG: hypothetical protein JW829_00275 [Pirellulales bacterium]|nr:hypothetical protein [Pirellulales bacterium]
MSQGLHAWRKLNVGRRLSAVLAEDRPGLRSHGNADCVHFPAGVKLD